MSCSIRTCNIRGGPHVAASMLGLVAISRLATPAKAEITDTDWSLKISEREMAFRPATDVMAMKTLMWDLPASRRAARNVPFICLTNDSATASITQFKMTIGDDQFHFANALMGMDAKFANSFFIHPDYRTVLFDMNGDNYYENAGIVNDPDSDDNSKVSITFSMGGMPSVTAGPTPFPDPNVLDGSARFINANIARYGDSDPIRSFPLSGGVSFIPEPGTAMLGLLGLLG